MKNYFKFFANLNRVRSASNQRFAVPLLIVTLFVTIGILTISCGGGGSGGTQDDYASINGTWRGFQSCEFLFKGRTAQLTYAPTWSDFGQARGRGYLDLGAVVYQNITRSSDRTWNAEIMILNGTYQSTGYHRCTLTLSVNGNLLSVYCNDANPKTTTLTRK